MPSLSLSYIKEKWQHAGFQKYFKNTGWAFAGRLFSLGMSFFVGALVARYLGPENYGIYNYVLSFVLIFVFLSSFGIDNILGREIIQYKEQRQSILNTAFTLKIIGGLTVIFITTFASFFIFKNTFFTSVLITIYSAHLLLLSLNVIETFFTSTVQYKYIFIGQFISTLVVSAFKIFLVLAGFGIKWFIISLILETFVYSSVLLFLFRRQGMKLSFNLNTHLAKKMLRDSWPFILSSAFYFIYTRVDQVMIGKMVDNNALGIYAAGVKPAEIWYFIPSLICSSIGPAVMNAKINNDKVYKNRLKKLFYLIIGLSVAIALFEFVFAKFIIVFLFGKTYLASVEILKVYTWAGVSVSLLTVIQMYLTFENKTKTIMVSSFVGAFVNIALNLLFIPKFGIIGSAYATLISYSSIPLIILLINKRLK